MQAKVEALIHALKQDNPGVEAVALYQHGEMVVEHHFVPSVPRCIYSHTKSFISTAVGMAVDAGKLKLTDRILDLFPEYATVVTDRRMETVELRHFLTMSSGIGRSLLSGDRRAGEGYPDYVAYMLSQPLCYEPGERFTYSNGDTHMAACMAQRALGEPLMRYLCDHLFFKMGIGYPLWECDPTGTPFGGSGLHLTIADMMKLGILYLHKGRWNGEQLVSEEWVRQAGSLQIVTGNPNLWNSGYGYQFWMVGQRPGVFRADGAYGQYSIVLPDDDAVLATQAVEYTDMLKLADLLLHYVIL